jgi:hypothetical protein
MEDEKSPFTVVFGCCPPVTFHTENRDRDGDGDNWPVMVKFEPESTVYLPVCATTSTSDGGDFDVDGGSYDITAVGDADKTGKENSFTFFLIHFLRRMRVCSFAEFYSVDRACTYIFTIANSFTDFF